MQIDDRYRTGVLLQKADETLGHAELHIQAERFEDAILSCYHSVFFTLRAFLKKNHTEPEKTSDSILIFKQNYIDNNIIPIRYYELLLTIVKKIQTDNDVADVHDAQKIFNDSESFYNYITDKI